MRDIRIGVKESIEGRTTFSALNIATATGIEILVEKISKAIFSKTKSTTFFDYTGADARSFSSKGAGDRATSELRVFFTGLLKQIEKNIIKDTPTIAPETEQLSAIVLDTLYFKDEKISGILEKVLYFKLKIYPKAGSVEYLTFPVDNRKW